MNHLRYSVIKMVEQLGFRLAPIESLPQSISFDPKEEDNHGNHSLGPLP
jgi:hypothetical protein